MTRILTDMAAAWLAVNAAVLLALVLKTHPVIESIVGILLVFAIGGWTLLALSHAIWPLG